MKTMYVIRWKSTVNGRAGKGTKVFNRADGQQLIDELNREYPQIHHELLEAESQTDMDSKSFSAEPMELARAR